MNVIGLIFLLIAHYITGKGLLKLLKTELSPVVDVCFSFMLGVAIISFAPCILQLMHLPIATTQVAVAISVMTVLFGIPIVVRFKKPVFQKIPLPALYEWPFLLVAIGLAFVSVWRCFYFPPYARDMLAGPELIAEFAVREKTFVNSIYHIDLHTSNNYFKSPFVTSLQVIYKLFVTPFGQLWLSVLFLSFTTWIYNVLRERVHPFLAGLLLIFFLAIPEVFAYTFVLLYDYSNMVFFCSGFFFLIRYLDTQKRSEFLLSVALFGFATYVRTETIILLALTVPALAFSMYRQKKSYMKIAVDSAIFMVVPFIFYFVCINIFVKIFVPLPFDLKSNVNSNLANLSPLFERFRDIHTEIIFTPWGVLLYGYFVYTFYFLVVADFIFKRKYTHEAKMALYGFAVVIIGLSFVGYLLPLADLRNTTKRGLFKIMPMILLYMANSSLVQMLSRAMTNWEQGTGKTAPSKVNTVKRVPPKPVNNPRPQVGRPNKK